MATKLSLANPFHRRLHTTIQYLFPWFVAIFAIPSLFFRQSSPTERARQGNMREAELFFNQIKTLYAKEGKICLYDSGLTRAIPAVHISSTLGRSPLLHPCSILPSQQIPNIKAATPTGTGAAIRPTLHQQAAYMSLMRRGANPQAPGTFHMDGSRFSNNGLLALSLPNMQGEGLRLILTTRCSSNSHPRGAVRFAQQLQLLPRLRLLPFHS